MLDTARRHTVISITHDPLYPTYDCDYYRVTCVNITDISLSTVWFVRRQTETSPSFFMASPICVIRYLKHNTRTRAIILFGKIHRIFRKNSTIFLDIVSSFLWHQQSFKVHRKRSSICPKISRSSDHFVNTLRITHGRKLYARACRARPAPSTSWEHTASSDRRCLSGVLCARAASPPLSLIHQSRWLTVSLSLCVPCGWRPVSECTPLLLSLPILFKHSLLRTTSVTPLPCSPTNQRPRLPTTWRLRQWECDGGCSTCPFCIAWIGSAIMRAGKQPDLRAFNEIRRAQLRNIPLAQYPTGCRATAPDHHVPTAASRCSSLMSCQLSVCHTFDTYRRVSRDGLIFFHFFLSLFSSFRFFPPIFEYVSFSYMFLFFFLFILF